MHKRAYKRLSLCCQFVYYMSFTSTSLAIVHVQLTSTTEELTATKAALAEAEAAAEAATSHRSAMEERMQPLLSEITMLHDQVEALEKIRLDKVCWLGACLDLTYL
jgi:chromosome segregation ATPase